VSLLGPLFDVPEPVASSAEPHTDADVLAALAAHDDRRALALCVEQHAAAILRLCLAMLGSASDADDLAQETLLSAHASWGAFRREGSVRAWLLGIARNKCLQFLEKSRRREQPGRQREGDVAAAADELLAQRERAERARALLEQIRPSDRDALLLRYVGELGFKDIAAIAGIDEAAARKRVSRALARLRQIAVGGTPDEQ
jgi:RNA polymerase sigma-70 factor, ECF subfamily